MLFNVLYAAAGVLLIPYFLYRRWVLRKPSAGLAAKLGRVPARLASGTDTPPRIWIHAVSVGEAAVAEPLVKALRAARPDADIVISTTTRTGQEVAQKKFGMENVFYYPLDFTFAIRAALDRIHPCVLVLMELEVWPNMTALCEQRGIPIVVVNGRVTARAGGRYQRFWWLVRGSFLRVKRWLVQTSEYAERLKSLGVPIERIEIAGNIKYDAIDTQSNPVARREKRTALGIPLEAPVLVGGSTHPSEEPELLRALKTLQVRWPELRLILVPRHPERTPDVERDVSAADFTPLRLTAHAMGTPLPPQTVLIVDRVGELKGMYHTADAAFIGGSLIPHGGQNIMEPCGLGVPALHGPHMHNFNDAMEILRACNGAIAVTRESLVTELERVFNDLPAAQARAERARAAFLQHRGATERTAAYVLSLID